MAHNEHADRHSAHGDKPGTAEQLVLPTLVFGISEVRRLTRELEALEDYMHQTSLRESGVQQRLPKVSRMLDDLSSQNHRNLLLAEDRTELHDFLQRVEHDAPVLHFSFASDPSSSFMAKLVLWLRHNIHPLALVTLGLQPSIAAGCIVRTSNKSFDFSLRHRLGEQHASLAEALRSVPVAPPGASPSVPTQNTPESAA